MQQVINNARAISLVFLIGCFFAVSDVRAQPEFGDETKDPLEWLNRPVYRFNEQMDRYVLKPVARGYKNIMPSPVRASVYHFFTNLHMPVTIMNNALQGKVVATGQDIIRFTGNSTIGMGGLFDPATLWGLPQHDEDLGQTLARWKIGSGWYLVLPFLGPSSIRHTIGRVGDGFTNPVVYIDMDDAWIGLAILDVIRLRAGLLGTEKLLEEQIDPYLFVRDAYLERRRSQIYDGNPPHLYEKPPFPGWEDGS